MRVPITLALTLGLAAPAFADQGAQVFRFDNPDPGNGSADQKVDPPQKPENQSASESAESQRSASKSGSGVAPSDGKARKLYDRLLKNAESPDAPGGQTGGGGTTQAQAGDSSGDKSQSGEGGDDNQVATPDKAVAAANNDSDSDMSQPPAVHAPRMPSDNGLKAVQEKLKRLSERVGNQPSAGGIQQLDQRISKLSERITALKEQDDDNGGDQAAQVGKIGDGVVTNANRIATLEDKLNKARRQRTAAMGGVEDLRGRTSHQAAKLARLSNRFNALKDEYTRAIGRVDIKISGISDEFDQSIRAAAERDAELSGHIDAVKKRAQSEHADLKKADRASDQRMDELTRMVANDQATAINGVASLLKQRDQRIAALSDRLATLEKRNARQEKQLASRASADRVAALEKRFTNRLAAIKQDTRDRIDAIQKQNQARFERLTKRLQAGNAKGGRVATIYQPDGKPTPGYTMTAILPSTMRGVGS